MNEETQKKCNEAGIVALYQKPLTEEVIPKMIGKYFDSLNFSHDMF